MTFGDGFRFAAGAIVCGMCFTVAGWCLSAIFLGGGAGIYQLLGN